MNKRLILITLFLIVCTFNSGRSQTITSPTRTSTSISNPLTQAQIQPTPTPTSTTTLRKRTFTFTFTFTKFPKPTSLTSTGNNRKSSETPSKVSTIGISIGLSISLLFLFISVGFLYFRNRSVQNQKVSPFVFTPARNIIKLNSQGSDPLKLTPPPVQKLDDNYEKLYMTPNLPLQSLQSQKPEQSLLPHAQRQPSHNLIQPAPENHISIHQSGSISQTSFVNQYALNFQPQSEVREDFPQRLIPKFQLPLNSLPLPVNSTPIRIPPPVLESFTVVESSTNSTTESLSVVANRLELMEKGNDR